MLCISQYYNTDTGILHNYNSINWDGKLIIIIYICIRHNMVMKRKWQGLA